MKPEPYPLFAALMNVAEFFIKGVIVGFVVAAPVGPVAVMCIHRTIAHGRIAGYVCGLGAAAADTIFGAIAALGLGFIAADIIAHNTWLRFVGGGILVVLGLRMVLARHLTTRAERQEEREEREERGDRLQPAPPASPLEYHIGNFISAFTVMITNPITLISFAAIFASIDISGIHDQIRWGTSLVIGVFLGGALWWTLLITGTAMIRRHVTETGILWVSRISGALILAFGIVLLVFPTTFGRAAERSEKAIPDLVAPATNINAAPATGNNAAPAVSTGSAPTSAKK